MSRTHKDWTDEERRAEARFTHAVNRLAKLDKIIELGAARLKLLRAERRRLRRVVEE